MFDTIQRVSLSFSAVCLLVVTGSAQSIYVDCTSGTTTGVPSANYAAAATSPGVWNSLENHEDRVLVDVQGLPTIVHAISDALDGSETQFPTTSGDDEALLDDYHSGDAIGFPAHYTLTNLRAGTYLFYLYTGGNGPLLNYFLSAPPGGSIEGGGSGFVPSGGNFPGTYAGWTVAIKVVHIPVDGSSLAFECTCFEIAGFQLVRVAEFGSLCSSHLGDCPCGIGAPGAGCPSSFSNTGAVLAAAGNRSVSADSVVLTATSVSNAFATIFQGTQTSGAGRGVAFGDGLRCAGGSVVRIVSKAASAGTLVYPESGETSISLRGAVPSAGGYRVYQVWYRNSASYCTSSTFNLTNGIAVDWTL